MSSLQSHAGSIPRLEVRHATQGSVPRGSIDNERTGDGDFPAGNVAARVGELALVASQAGLHAAWDGGAGEMEARGSMRVLCQAARSGGVPIERLLILIKAAWHQLPDNRRRMDPTTQATLARIVTICIHEYYRPRDRS